MQNFVFLCYKNVRQIFAMEAGDLLDSVKFSDGVKKALRAGSHCGGGELCH